MKLPVVKFCQFCGADLNFPWLGESIVYCWKCGEKVRYPDQYIKHNWGEQE